jgi:uncharacterized membrane-anchored protein
MHAKLLVAAVALPLVAVAAGVVRAELHLSRSKEWEFRVAGYDPRDLLEGHYIRLRVELDQGASRTACSESQGDSCCLCLTALGAHTPPRAERATCEVARAECDGAVREQELRAIDRYYVPESRAEELTRRFQQAARQETARLVVAVDARGIPQVKALVVDGERLEEAHSP